MAPLPSLPPEVTTGDDELRRLIDAGASTPEELRELAARIREHREREDAALAGARCGRRSRRPRRPASGSVTSSTGQTSPDVQRRAVSASASRASIIVLVLAAAQSSMIWVLLPLVGVLGYAYRQGKRGDAVDESPPPQRGRPRLTGRYPRTVTRGRTAKLLTQHWDGTALRRRPDQLIVEEPLEVHLDGQLVGTTMRTPGHDFELAVGLVHGDGLLGGRAGAHRAATAPPAARWRAASTS